MGWEIKKLGEVSNFQGGSQPPKSQFIDKPRNGYIRLLQIRDFKSDRQAVYIPITKKNRTCEADDIMIGRYGASVGQIHRGKAGAYNVALIKTTPDENLIDKNFFYLYLTSTLFQEPLMSVADRSAQAGFSKADIMPFEVPLPPLPEQQRIVAILDEAFDGINAAIANTQQNLANARELFESYLNNVFTQKAYRWDHHPLEELTDEDSKITYGVVKPGPEGKIPFVRGGDIADGRIKTENLRTITKEFSEQYRRTLLRGGEILMCLVGVPGQTAVAPIELHGANIARQVGLIRLRPEINPHFVSFFLRSRTGLEGLGAYIGGSVQQVINLRDLKLVRVPLPERSVQDDTVTSLERIGSYAAKLESNFNKKLVALAELKQSILQQAFSGELTKEQAAA